MKLYPYLVLLTAVAACPQNVVAKTFSEVAAEAKQAVADAQVELDLARQERRAEMRELSIRLTQLEQEELALEKEAEASRAGRDTKLEEIAGLKRQVAEAKAAYESLKNAIGAYSRKLSDGLSGPEFDLASEPLLRVDSMMKDGSPATPTETTVAQLEVLRLSLDRVRSLVGGKRIQGSVSEPDDEKVFYDGRYALIGPIAFVSDDTGRSGIAIDVPNRAYPILFNKGLSPETVGGIASVVDTGSGRIPFDPTDGDAIRIINAQDDLVTHIVKGGVTMVPLLGLFFVAVCIAVFKVFELRSIAVPREAVLTKIVDSARRGDFDTAEKLAASVPGPFGEILTAGFKNADQPEEVLEEALYDRLLTAQPKLERFISFISLTAAASPLLGLLGTVTGMIQTFKAITIHGTGDPATLSDGISVALITTEYGLIVAVPCLITQLMLSRVARSKLSAMEKLAVSLANAIRLARA